MTQIEEEIQKFNQIKIDLLQISKCIECCQGKDEEEMYQNIAIQYTKELKKIKEFIEKEYEIVFCSSCCKF